MRAPSKERTAAHRKRVAELGMRQSTIWVSTADRELIRQKITELGFKNQSDVFAYALHEAFKTNNQEKMA